MMELETRRKSSAKEAPPLRKSQKSDCGVGAGESWRNRAAAIAVAAVGELRGFLLAVWGSLGVIIGAVPWSSYSGRVGWDRRRGAPA